MRGLVGERDHPFMDRLGSFTIGLTGTGAQQEVGELEAHIERVKRK
jgi:hypothetical protein